MCPKTIPDHLSITDWISIAAAIIVLLAGYYTIRIQVVTSLQNQLYIKASDCNKFIVEETQAIPVEDGKKSAIITAILFGQALISNYFKAYWFFLLFTRRQLIANDYFYLQLHTSIVMLIKNEIEIKDKNENIRSTIIRQHKDAGIFLKKSILKFSCV